MPPKKTPSKKKDNRPDEDRSEDQDKHDVEERKSLEEPTASVTVPKVPTSMQFDGTDYATWSKDFRELMELYGLWNQFTCDHQDHDHLAPDSDAELSSSSSTYQSRLAAVVLRSAIKSTEVKSLLNDVPSGDARAMWRLLEKHYLRMTPAATMALKSEMWTMRQQPDETVHAFAQRIRECRRKLEAGGDRSKVKDVNTVFINGLLPVCDAVRGVLLTMLNERLEELEEVARAEEDLQLKRRGVKRSIRVTEALGAVPTSKPKYNRATVRCFSCGQLGHVKRECTAVLVPNSNQSQTNPPRCQWCRHIGHTEADCRKKKAGQAPTPPNNQGAGPSSAPQQQKRVIFAGAATAPREQPAVEKERKHCNGAHTQTVNLATAEVHAASMALNDSGASRTVLSKGVNLLNARPAPSDLKIRVGNGQELSGARIGTAVLDTGTAVLHLRNALQHDDVALNMISVSSMLESDTTKYALFAKDRMWYLNENWEPILSAPNINGVYPLELNSNTTTAAATVTTPVQLWHARLGHRALTGIKELQQTGAVRGLDGVSIDLNTEHRCDGCAKGKATRRPFKRNADPRQAATRTLACVHADLMGPFPCDGLNGEKYFLHLVDEYSRQSVGHLLSTKDEAADQIIKWCKQASNKQPAKIAEFHSDGGGEFVNRKLSDFFDKEGIKHTVSVPHTPQHNGLVERANRTILESALAMMFHAATPARLWPYALQYAVYVKNRTIMCPNSKETPESRWTLHDEAPTVEHLRVFGCDADYTLTGDTSQRELRKLSPKSQLTMMIGYSEDRRAWILLNVDSMTLTHSRDVNFHENEFTQSRKLKDELVAAEDSDDVSNDIEQWVESVALRNEIELVKQISLEESKNSNSPSSVLKRDTMGVQGSKEAVGQRQRTSAASSNRRSSRSSIPPLRYGMVNAQNLAQARCIYALSAESHFAAEPKTYAEACTRSDSKEWKESIQQELNSHCKNGTWELVDRVSLPPDTNIMGNKWVFRYKISVDGSIERRKSRLVAKGYTQRENIDYFETFAPVMHYKTLRLLLGLCAVRGWILQHWDVETAFLNAEIKETVYMVVPEGVHAPGKVCRLRKTLYGVKQAPREWNLEISSTIVTNLNFTQCQSDACVFVRQSRSGGVILMSLFVDDVFTMCQPADAAELEECFQAILQKYTIKNLGDAKLMLGMRLTRDETNHTIKLDQELYVKKLLADCGMDHCVPLPTPAQTRQPTGATLSLTTDSQMTNEDCQQLKDHASYRALIGSLLYLALATRPDIAHPVAELARHVSNPTDDHWLGLKRILRYLCGTASLGLKYSAEQSSELLAYSDSDWAGDRLSDAKSTTGWLTMIGGGLVSWTSRKQSIVALSSTEAEYIAYGEAVQEMLWLRQLLQEIRQPCPGPTILRCDNQSAIALATNDKHHQRTKHINVRHHFLRQHVNDKAIVLEWVPSQEQLADILTKPLGPNIYKTIRDQLVHV